MTSCSTQLPVPGAWVIPAQSALDALSALRTIDDVHDCFGSARVLTETILGYPVSGGHATKPVVRAVGSLLHHRLGPSVAAEALSWAASVAEVVDTAMIEALLAAATDAHTVCRPLTLADRLDLQDRLLRIDHRPARLAELLRLWHDTPASVEPIELDGFFARWNDQPLGSFEDEDDCGERNARVDGTFRVLPDLLERAASDVEQAELLASIAPYQLRQLAAWDRLFDLPDETVGACLLRYTAMVLAHPSCPEGLRSRVRFPCDVATLELALRAGPGFAEKPQLRRMLHGLSPDDRAHLLAVIPLVFVTALRHGGLLRPADLLTGDLAVLDLDDAEVRFAALGRPDDGALGVDDADLAVRLGGVWAATCPGVPANQRPPRLLTATWPSAWTRSAFVYPPEIEGLAGATFAEAPGWTILLPRHASDVERNARRMHNCTTGYITDIAIGSRCLLIVQSPDGTPYNVMLYRSGTAWWDVCEINSRFNGGERPDWIVPALQAWFRRPRPPAAVESDPTPAPPRRRPTPHRDRRRRRSSAARRVSR